MIRRLRLLLPPDPVLVVFGVFYALAGMFDGFAWLWGNLNVRINPLYYQVPYGGVLMYGAYRVFLFHPAYLPNYRSWLELTPWTRRMPLPGGPVHIVWEDAVIVAMVITPSWYRGAAEFWIGAVIFLTAYSMAMIPALCATKSKNGAYATVFGVGAVIRLSSFPVECSLAAATTALIAMLGFRHSLRNFPWCDNRLYPLVLRIGPDAAIQNARAGTRLGWPYDLMGPAVLRSRPRGPKLLEGILLSLMLGWLNYAVMAIIPMAPDRNVLLSFIFGPQVILLSITRLMLYLPGFVPPLSILGRLRKLRPIIGGYDQVFVTPIVALAVAGAGPAFLLAYVPDLGIVYPMTLAVVAGVVLLGGPSYEQWALTGNHRIVMIANRAEFTSVG
jgi:hypothetical protein